MGNEKNTTKGSTASGTIPPSNVIVPPAAPGVPTLAGVAAAPATAHPAASPIPLVNNAAGVAVPQDQATPIGTNPQAAAQAAAGIVAPTAQGATLAPAPDFSKSDSVPALRAEVKRLEDQYNGEKWAHDATKKRLSQLIEKHTELGEKLRDAKNQVTAPGSFAATRPWQHQEKLVRHEENEAENSIDNQPDHWQTMLRRDDESEAQYHERMTEIDQRRRNAGERLRVQAGAGGVGSAPADNVQRNTEQQGAPDEFDKDGRRLFEGRVANPEERKRDPEPHR